jgi:hypothetical protein
MPAGNASNTVFTAIPVGEDFYMSFSTERFHRNISPADFVYLNFKLYDARIIGSIDSPNPNALIIQYNNQPTDTYTDVEGTDPNLNGRSSSFSVSTQSVSVMVLSSDLDNYERTKTGNSAAVFRGELYGYIEAVVTGEETSYARLQPAAIRCSAVGTAEMVPYAFEEWWDTQFFNEDVRRIICRSTINSPVLGVKTV